MKLYSYWRSSSSYRVRIVLAMKQIAYDYVAVNLYPESSEQLSEGYGQVSSMQQVPVLEWDDGSAVRRLTQSVAIVEYLNERWPAPALLPLDPLERARIREAVEIVNSGIQPLQNLKVLAMIRKSSGEEAADAWLHDVVDRGLSALERLAKATGAPFFSGKTPTLADVFIVPQLYVARRFGVDVQRYPRLAQIESESLAHAAFAAADPARQPDAPRPGS